MRTSNILKNGAATLLGAGLNHRHLSQDELGGLAASVVAGERPFIPSAEQMCMICRIPRYVLSKHKARRKNGAANGNGANPPSTALTAGVEDTTETELVVSPAKLIEIFTYIASKLGEAKTLDILAAIERANSET